MCQVRTMGTLEEAVRQNAVQVAQVNAMKADQEEAAKLNMQTFFEPYEPQTFTGRKGINFSEFGRELDADRRKG